MKRTQPSTSAARQQVGAFRIRGGLALALAGLGVACWLGPARAQEHAPAVPPAETAAPVTTDTPDKAITRQGGEAHPAGEAPAPGETHPAGEAHGEGGAAQGEGSPHGEEEGPKFEIEYPTALTGAVRDFHHRGPATVSAAGAVKADGSPATEADLKGKTAEFEYEDEESHAHPKPRYQVRATIDKIGTAKPMPGAHTQTVTVGGEQYTFVSPAVTFAYASLVPEKLLISLLTALGIAIVAFLLTRNLALVPSRKQTLVELIYEFLDSNIYQLIGPHYKKYVPLIGTAFLYILFMNLVGLIPWWSAPTANINVTAGLAIVIVVYVQIEGIRANGLIGYLKHFVGEPWWLGPLNVPIHVIGEVARILSLTIRLFGNMFGEDVVIAILIGLAVMFTKGIVPFQAPMYLMAMFTSFVQAAVFSILASVYIALMTTHEDHGEHGHGAEPAHHDDHGHIQEAAAPAPAV